MLTSFILVNQTLKKLKETEISNAIKTKQGLVWINISSASNENIELLKGTFKVHPTTIEDIFSEQTPSKIEEFEEYKLITFKGIQEIKQPAVDTYNLSFILGKNFIITIDSEKQSSVRELIKNEKRIELLLKKGKSWIMHYLLDKEVDKYLKIKSELNEKLKEEEKEFMNSQGKMSVTKMYNKEIMFIELRHLSESVTDLCYTLTKLSDDKAERSLIPYYKDIYDHALKTTEGYESILKRIEGMEEWYATMTNLKTNEVIRYLTIITALMMPLTIIPGIYGMNIHLPFQEHPYAFFIIWGFMFFFTLIMIWISKREGWLAKKEI